MTSWNKALVLKQIEQSTKSATWAVIKLWQQQEFVDSDTNILSGFAEQAVWRQREIERGDRSVDCPLLSPKQIDLARLLLPKYWRQLVAIANSRRPERADQAACCYGLQLVPNDGYCRRCGEEYICFYEGTPLCKYCLPVYRRARQRYPCRLEDADKARLHEELDLSTETGARAERVETEALVIKGRNIRFKSAKEFAEQYSEERHGMPRELASALAETNMKHNPDVSTAELFEDDPFDFEEKEKPL